MGWGASSLLWGWARAVAGCAKPRPDTAFTSPPLLLLRGVSAQSASQPPNIWFLSSGWIFSVSCIQICWPHQADKSESRCQVFNRFLRLITISIHLYYKLIVVTFNLCLVGNIYFYKINETNNNQTIKLKRVSKIWPLLYWSLSHNLNPTLSVEGVVTLSIIFALKNQQAS